MRRKHSLGERFRLHLNATCQYSVLLLRARPAALDQDKQHGAKEHTGNDTNEFYTVHCIASLLFSV
jgi:hypothetical protein